MKQELQLSILFAVLAAILLSYNINIETKPIIFDQLLSNKTSVWKVGHEIKQAYYSYKAVAHFEGCDERFNYEFRLAKTDENPEKLFWQFSGILTEESRGCFRVNLGIMIITIFIGVFFLASSIGCLIFGLC